MCRECPGLGTDSEQAPISLDRTRPNLMKNRAPCYMWQGEQHCEIHSQLHKKSGWVAERQTQMITLDHISKHQHTSKESRQTGAKDTKATRINKGFQKCRWNVKVETPMYANTKFSIRKFSSSNNWNRDSRLLFQLTSDRPTIQTHSVQHHKLACLSKPTYQLTSTSQHVSPARVNAEACIMYLSNALPQRQTLAVWATDSNAPVELVHGHSWTDPPGVYVCCATYILKIKPHIPVTNRACGTLERQGCAEPGKRRNIESVNFITTWSDSDESTHFN